jgi:hypothetical protein
LQAFLFSVIFTTYDSDTSNISSAVLK